ncbi:hypothetical protein LXA43DRAFT_892270 [Ganoderma leucocontextum]|nr:hypothetical protein LXA43DRAFT_892270 [Ganoderma leucocontextum]
MFSYFPPHDDPSRQPISIPPHLLPGPPIGGFAYPAPCPPAQPFPLSYPLQAPHFPPQFPPVMHHQYPYPTGRHFPNSFIADPAFSPDPRSNPHFFSMNDREEIYPASLSGSFSDYPPTLPDDESEVDHTNLPPRMRHLAGPDVVIPPRHSRSQSVSYGAPPSLSQNLSRSNSARVIPVPPPPPITPPSPLRSNRRRSSREDLPENPTRPSPVHTSASAAAQVYWQPPPPYSDSESASSSSNPQTPSSSPPSSTHRHLLREPKAPTVSTPSPPEKRSLSEPQPISSARSSSAHTVPQSRNDAPPPVTKASSRESSAVYPRISPRNASAPELHSPPAPIDIPPRPSTVPIPAPPPETPSAPLPSRRRNSKNPSISTPPRDLDSIDELDESDPLGFAWHHGGPYEAIAKATGSARNPDSGASAHHPSKPKRKPVQAYDSVSVGIDPGQIFPSFSQYQPQAVGNGAQVDLTVLPEMPPAENFQVLSPPRSPLVLPVQRRVPQTGQPPSTPDQYNNVHMNLAMDPAPTMSNFSVPVEEMRASRMPRPQTQQPSPEAQPAPERQLSQTPSPPAYGDAPQVSPPLPNPYSPSGSGFPNAPPSRHKSGPRPASTIHPRPELPPSNIVPRPDIALPPQRQQDKTPSLLPRHLPKRLVMPAPLQQHQNQNLQQGQAHVEILAQRHRPSAPSLTSQQVRAKDIPISHGPKLLRKKHTSGAPQPESSMPSNTTAAMFAAKVRFAEPPREETREERKKREKEETKREREEAKREKERAKSGQPPEIPLQGIFAVDYVKEAELAREREFAKMGGAKAARKLSKRR